MKQEQASVEWVVGRTSLEASAANDEGVCHFPRYTRSQWRGRSGRPYRIAPAALSSESAGFGIAGE
jgi:hypothetical protein